MSGRRARVGLGALLALLAAAPPAAGQEPMAEVRTRAGQVWRVTHPVVERLTTVVVKESEASRQADTSRPFAPSDRLSPSSPSTASTISESPAGPTREMLVRQARYPVDALTLYQGASELRIPLARIRLLVLSRELVAGSPLPPYVAVSHFRHAAVVVLTDGSRVEGDYVNLGATVLRGTAREGQVEIAWDEIESVRFGP
jgi:hypothetical protein